MSNFITRWFFSVPSIILHTGWFIVWFWGRLDVGLLTNVVSLEAIYLSIFIGIAQKDHHEKLKKHVTKLHLKNPKDSNGII